MVKTERTEVRAGASAGAKDGLLRTDPGWAARGREGSKGPGGHRRGARRTNPQLPSCARGRAEGRPEGQQGEAFRGRREGTRQCPRRATGQGDQKRGTANLTKLGRPGRPRHVRPRTPGASAQEHGPAEPIVTAARFPAGATKAPHVRGGVRRRDAAARDGPGGGRGGGERRRIAHGPPRPAAMSTKQVTCR